MAAGSANLPDLSEAESDTSYQPGNDTESSSYETVTEDTETEAAFMNVFDELGESDSVDDDGDDDAEAEDDEEEDDDDDDESTFLDAEEVLLDILPQDEEDGEDQSSDHGAAIAGSSQDTSAANANVQADESNSPQPMTISRSELLQLLSQTGAFRRIFRSQRGIHLAGFDDDDGDGSDGFYGSGMRRRRRPRTGASADLYPKIPSETGQKLMESGVFGTNERDQGSYSRKKQLATRIMHRELGLEPPGKQRTHNRLASQSLIPSSSADFIVHYDARCYSGQFSDDGNFFFSCSQDFRVRMYDTSNPYKWRYYKTVEYHGGQWTITDATLSPDNKFLAYSSIRSMVCLAPTDPGQESTPYYLDFANLNRRARGGAYNHGHFGIWSLRFSGDGREIVAGTSDYSVYVYDIETRQSILRIHGHDHDVNAVCFGDKSSPHLLYSGSDDTTLKVWDRRSLGDSREAGVFVGHTEGLTYVDSKGDGRYVLSNGKDQTMKLWDLRKMISTEKAERIDLLSYSSGFDYRFQTYDEEDYRPHPEDCSLVTFRGHSVLKTLIRCHFSPPGSTDSRYVYTGSEDGTVYIYNLDATIAGKLNVQSTTQNPRPHENNGPYAIDSAYGRAGSQWETCVRDASWHPNAPVIAATSWNGYGMSNGTCTVHTWNDGVEDDEAEPRMGQRVNAQLQRDDALYAEIGRYSTGTRRRRRMI